MIIDKLLGEFAGLLHTQGFGMLLGVEYFINCRPKETAMRFPSGTFGDDALLGN
jgi:hypothetical protein